MQIIIENNFELFNFIANIVTTYFLLLMYVTYIQYLFIVKVISDIRG